VTRGFGFTIGWAGNDPDDNARITIFLDVDEAYSGNEQILRDDIEEDDAGDQQHVVDTGTLTPGAYRVGGIISDGYRSVVAYGGCVCLVERLVGRFSPDELGAGRIATVSGGPDNYAFGAAVDISRSLDIGGLSAGGGGELAELLIGDPLAMVRYYDQEPIRVGAVYLRWNDGQWPRQLSVGDMSTRIIGERQGADTGRRLALIENVGFREGTQSRDILIGAHHYFMEKGEGVAYHFPAGPGPGDVYLGTGAATRLFGSFGDYAGLDVAALGDLDGGGAAEFAVGAIQLGGIARGAGQVYILAGEGKVYEGPLSSAAGLTLVGVEEGDQTGYAICGLPDVGGTEPALDEIVVGAPRARQVLDLPTSRPGVVYVVFGETWMLQEGGIYPLSRLGLPDGLRGLLFVGKNDGDETGAALAAGDFDGDGRPDLLIGAPGFDNGRGRVYLVYDLGNPALPQAPQPIELALLGQAYPGAVFEGIAQGDRLGSSLAAADFDGDGADDLLMGAPASESQRGAMFLIYGGQSGLAGSVALAPLPTCRLHGVQLVGMYGRVDRLGESLSGGGDLNGDGVDDVAVGAPGDAGRPGEVHLLFGWPQP